MRGVLPDFMRDFHRAVAMAIKEYRGIAECVWADASTSTVELHGDKAQIDSVLYGAMNPVRAGLVEKASDWPGTIWLPGRRELVVRRPDVWFSERMPEEVRVPIVPPPMSELDSFFDFVRTEWTKVQHQRGLLRSSLGYARNHEDALKRFLEDGRLKLDNNASERALRKVAVGRKNWLFVGSDDHAQSTANLLSMIASARPHDLDPEDYLRDLFRVLPFWPNDRYLELAPKHWLATRARLDAVQMEQEVGWLTIPPPQG